MHFNYFTLEAALDIGVTSHKAVGKSYIISVEDGIILKITKQ